MLHLRPTQSGLLAYSNLWSISGQLGKIGIGHVNVVEDVLWGVRSFYALGEVEASYRNGQSNVPYEKDLARGRLFEQHVRHMGTKTVDRTPAQMNNYIIQRECAKCLRKFRSINPGSDEAKALVGDTVRYYGDMLIERGDVMTSRNGAGMLYRMAKFQIAGNLDDWWWSGEQAEVVGGVANVVYTKMFRLKPPEAATCIWSFGILGQGVMDIPLPRRGKIRDVVHELLVRCGRDIDMVKPIEMTSLVEGLARLKYPKMDWIMTLVTKEVKSNIVKYKERDLPRMLWALANMSWTDASGLLSTLAWESKRRVGLFEAKDLSMLLWGFAVLGFKDIQHLLWVTSIEGVPRFKFGIEPQYVVKFIWAYDNLEHYPSISSVRKLSQELSVGMHELLPPDIGVALVSLHNLGYPDKEVLERVVELLRTARVGEMNPRSAANIMWALAANDHLEQDVFTILRRDLMRARDCMDDLPDVHKKDIFRCLLHMMVFRPTMGRMLPFSLFQACQQAWINSEKSGHVADIMDDVVKSIEGLDYKVNESEAIQGGVVVCSSMEKDGEKYLLDVVVPPRCYRNLKGSVNGTQTWREKLVNSWGHRMVKVHEEVWKDLEDDDSKKEYLEKCIEAA